MWPLLIDAVTALVAQPSLHVLLSRAAVLMVVSHIEIKTVSTTPHLVDAWWHCNR
jgi:hypothetical protein